MGGRVIDWVGWRVVWLVAGDRIKKVGFGWYIITRD